MKNIDNAEQTKVGTLSLKLFRLYYEIDYSCYIYISMQFILNVSVISFLLCNVIILDFIICWNSSVTF